MVTSVNRLRDALLDAIDARDETVRTVADAGMRHAVYPVAEAVVAAAMPDATDQSNEAASRSPAMVRSVLEALCCAGLHAVAHVAEHVPRVRAAGPGADLGPVRRAELDARRLARLNQPTRAKTA